MKREKLKLISIKTKRKAPKQTAPEQQGHARRFDQLLDDAIFGVKKKKKKT